MKNILMAVCFACLSNFAWTQCISGDCSNGKGTFVYPSGARYTGDFKNGEIHGLGVCYYTDNSKYSGEWKNRYPDGKGTKTYSDGTKRIGWWKKGKPVDEMGNLQEEYVMKIKTDEDTNIQVGCISGNCVDGIGVFAFADGSKYEGAFADSSLNGQGTFYYANNDHYTGNFKNNLPNGLGTKHYAGGKNESGNWINGEFKGSPIAESENTGCISGDCESGSGTYVFKAASAKYTGTFLNNYAHGVGTCIFANGDSYSGEWLHGTFGGQGTLTLHDETKIEGYWENGEYLGKEPPVKTTNSQTTTPLIPAPVPKIWAVIAGVASYDHMPTLKYTDDDAYRYYAFLKSLEGGAIPDNQVRILIDEDATRENVLENLTDIFAQAGPNDLVIFYFSGHGLNGYFLPIDFDGYNNKLSHEEIAAVFQQCKAKYKLCLADACHSGSLLAMRSTEVESTLNQFYSVLSTTVSGTALIMSSKSEETSLESSGLRQGVFSHFLIRGLKGEADNNLDNIVSVGEIFEFVYAKVRDYTAKRQSPVIKGNYDPSMPVAVIRQ
jgi:hypothetical protein